VILIEVCTRKHFIAIVCHDDTAVPMLAAKLADSWFYLVSSAPLVHSDEEAI
jgi:hypothetical protein